jgi:acetylornithine deacetylase/succinyl-diaminopimelate desuccinylase-like protein
MSTPGDMKRAPDFLEQVMGFVRIPSVSTLPAHAEDVRRAAHYLAGILEAAGLQDVAVQDTEGHPVVTAFGPGAPGAPVILVYGHYDVQPADPIAAWTHDPFDPVVRDGRLYGRGASDDKTPLLQAVEAARRWMAAQGRLPVGVRFLFEGEEEIGSPSLPGWLADHAADWGVTLAVSTDGAMWDAERPSVIVGAKGLVALRVTVTTAATDLHSGRHGGAAPNALHALARLVASLHDADGRVAVPGFYEAARPPAPEERAAWHALGFSDDAYRAREGLSKVIGEGEYTVIERLFARPTLDVNGMVGGYTGPGIKTVIPAEARMTLSCRLVPDQEPELVAGLVTRHLLEAAPFDARIEVEVLPGSSRPYRLAPDHVGVRAVADSLMAVFGVAPTLVRMGGTLPAADLFRRTLGVDTVFLSFSTADEHFHAANEFFRLERLQPGVEAWYRLYQAMGQYGREGGGNDASS